MEPDLLGEVAQGVEGVLVVGEGVEAGWEGPAPELDPGGSVYAPVAAPRSFIKPGSPVIT
jgi:hypothetical protein